MIVVDAGLLVALTLRTPDTETARRLFLSDPEWAAPPLWRSDFRGALYRLIRGGTITRAQAAQAFAGACEVIGENEIEPATAVVLDLALTLGLDMYDAEFVAAARELGVKLVTLDGDLAAIVPDRATLPPPAVSNELAPLI